MSKTPEEVREYHRNYYQEHAEHLRGLSRKSYNKVENKEKKSIYSRNRRAARTPEEIARETEQDRVYNKAHTTEMRAATKRCYESKVKRFNLLKLDRPCYDCGGMFPPTATDWDHLPGTEKCFDVSKGIRSHSEAVVFDEIAKCQLVCACCHRIRTENRRKEKL